MKGHVWLQHAVKQMCRTYFEQGATKVIHIYLVVTFLVEIKKAALNLILGLRSVCLVAIKVLGLLGDVSCHLQEVIGCQRGKFRGEMVLAVVDTRLFVGKLIASTFEVA